MDAAWTLPELVGEVAARIAALPAQANGQVRGVPDDRTIRYYGTIGLLDRPVAMRGRTAVYGRRHLAQVVAIKRLQSAGKSLAQIQTLWATLTDETLARMSGVSLSGVSHSGVAQSGSGSPRKEFWRAEPGAATPSLRTEPSAAMELPARASLSPPPMAMELRIELAPGAVLSLVLSETAPLTPEALRAIRAAAQPLIAELARRPLASHDRDHEPGDAP